jgi:hypothetical protein
MMAQSINSGRNDEKLVLLVSLLSTPLSHLQVNCNLVVETQFEIFTWEKKSATKSIKGNYF